MIGQSIYLSKTSEQSLIWSESDVSFSVANVGGLPTIHCRRYFHIHREQELASICGNGSLGHC